MFAFRIAAPPAQLSGGRRRLWTWLTIVFNRVDPERIERVGADVACAEWLLRNGASVRWRGAAPGRFTDDYNSLPSSSSSSKIEEVDASHSGVSHYGFAHFRGCTAIKSIVLDDCRYVDDRAMSALADVEGPLERLQISNCPGVTEKGLRSLPKFPTLKLLVLHDLLAVEDIETHRRKLEGDLSCEVRGRN